LRVVSQAAAVGAVNIDFKVGPHHLRHAFATHTFRTNGKDIKKVSVLLRHKSTTVTSNYIHQAIEDIDEDNILDIIE